MAFQALCLSAPASPTARSDGRWPRALISSLMHPCPSYCPVTAVRLTRRDAVRLHSVVFSSMRHFFPRVSDRHVLWQGSTTSPQCPICVIDLPLANDVFKNLRLEYMHYAYGMQMRWIPFSEFGCPLPPDFDRSGPRGVNESSG